MMLSTLAVCLVLSISATSGAKFPSNFQRCNRKASDFDQCLSLAAENGIKQLNKPIKSVGLPIITPLEIPSLTIPAGNNIVGLQQSYTNMKLYGFAEPKNTKFRFDFDKKTAYLESSFDELRVESHYNVTGKILLLPVFGSGPSVITLERVVGRETFKLEEYERKGKKYFRVVGSKLKLDPQRVRFNMDNLYDGNKELGDNINKVLNDNWREIFNEVGYSYEQAFGDIIKTLFNNFLTRVPISELFSDE